MINAPDGARQEGRYIIAKEVFEAGLSKFFAFHNSISRLLCHLFRAKLIVSLKAVRTALRHSFYKIKRAAREHAARFLVSVLLNSTALHYCERTG